MKLTVPSLDRSSLTKATPIAIPNNNRSTRDQDEYSLTQTNFDPNKSSPPSSWDNRLRARLGNDYHMKFIL